MGEDESLSAELGAAMRRGGDAAGQTSSTFSPVGSYQTYAVFTTLYCKQVCVGVSN